MEIILITQTNSGGKVSILEDIVSVTVGRKKCSFEQVSNSEGLP